MGPDYGETSTPTERPARPKTSLDTAQEVLQAQGITGRGEVILSLSLSCDIRRGMADRVKEQQPYTYDTDLQRSMVERYMLNAPNRGDIIWDNRNQWEAAQMAIDFDYLDHTFTGRTEDLREDAAVLNLMSALTLMAWGKTQGEFFAETVPSEVSNQLHTLARSLIQKNFTDPDWKRIAEIAKKYADSPLIDQVHKIAQIWNEKRFAPSSKDGRAVDNILESHIAVTNPEGVMAAAKQIYNSAFELDLDQQQPVHVKDYRRQQHEAHLAALPAQVDQPNQAEQQNQFNPIQPNRLSDEDMPTN